MSSRQSHGKLLFRPALAIALALTLQLWRRPPRNHALKTPKALSSEDIQRAVLKRLELYNELNFLEESAMFMGKAQLLETALKQLLARR